MKILECKALIEELGNCLSKSGSRNWTEVRQFNLMIFQGTKLDFSWPFNNGLVFTSEKRRVFSSNFLNITNQDEWVAVHKRGKAFRNEIVARQFIFSHT
jgi:glycyl-tRNA synthetase